MTRRRSYDDATLPLFGISEPRPARSAPAVFDHIAERDKAMAKVAEHAEIEFPNFADMARNFVLRYLASHGASSGEDITDACKAAGIVPHDDRSFGPVYMSLSRSKQIQRVGFCARKRGHGTAGGNVWGLATAEQ